MDYFIRKGSDYSEVTMELVKDGHTDYESFFKDIQDSTIKFNMVDSDTGFVKIPKGSVEACIDGDDCFLSYKFNPRDLNTVGTYIGKFIITFNQKLNIDSSKEILTVPIREDLKIHILP